MAEKRVEILLVEDNPDDEELVLDALKSNQITSRIEVVHDGAAALDFLFCAGAYAHRRSEDYPKVVLLDLKLPKVTGLEVLRRVKTDPRTKMIPIVMLTSSREERDVVESYQLGVNAYLVKPVEFEQFSEMVKESGLYWLFLNHPPVL
jgi:two-component system, response regulator